MYIKGRFRTTGWATGLLKNIHPGLAFEAEFSYLCAPKKKFFVILDKENFQGCRVKPVARGIWEIRPERVV
jgi:hypothetical protein